MPEIFKVGERVRFLRERQEGVVQRIISHSRLEVLIDDFVEMEVDAGDVVRINASEAVFKREEEEAAKGTPVALPQLGAEREPVFVVHRTPNRDYELWILNHSRREIFLTIHQKSNGKFKGVNAVALQPSERRMVSLMNTQEFHQVQNLIVQMMQFTLGERARPMPMLTLEISCKADILNQDPVVIPDVGADGWEFVLEEKAATPYTEAAQMPLFKAPTQGPEVVDLHIEKLVPSLMGVSSAMMLQIQMEHFEKAITDAQMRKAKTMVFIHGVGSGKLRKEMNEKLRYYTFVKSFDPADPLQYGNGATMVSFK